MTAACNFISLGEKVLSCRVFSSEVTAAILVSQNNEMAAILLLKTNPMGLKLYSYSIISYCFSSPIWPPVT